MKAQSGPKESYWWKKIRRFKLKFILNLTAKMESFNVLAGVVVFVGTSSPEVEADFNVLGQANEVVG